MCGIAGFLSRHADERLVTALARALQRLEHRGPDDRGSLTFPESPDRGPLAGLGNRRLSIIDPSATGHQPMTTADGRYSVTYNGEIYNYRELRTELEGLGRRFVSQCDTEVLLQAWAAWGPACLARFEGMFAFALLDRVGGRLILARDAFGIKPLFYSRGDDRIVFASELAAVFEFDDVGRQVNATKLRDFLVEGHTGSGAETLWADVRQVPPAHYLDLALDLSGDAIPVRYWSADAGERRDVSFADAADELRALVEDSVRIHLRSDMPLGFSLSGGLDSSSVLLAARRALGPQGELHAFGFVADDGSISEAAWQAKAAAAAGATLHDVRVTAADVARDFDRTIDIQGEPFGSPTIYAQYRVFARAREAGIKVILGGQGSDELFAGYTTYLPARVASLLRQGRWPAAAQLAGTAAARWGVGRGQLWRSSAVLAMPAPLEGALRRVMGRPAGGGQPDWLRADWFAGRGTRPATRWRPRGREVLREALVETLENAHLQGLMRYEDRSAMALSMESRVPLLTPRLARFAMSLPEACHVSAEAELKAVLRGAMRGVLPDAILDRRDKVGFAVPVAQWLVEQGPWVENRLAQAGTCPAIDLAALRRRWTAVRERGSVAAAYTLWRSITLATWAERGAVQWS